MAITCHSKSCNTYTINFTVLWKICLHLLLCYQKKKKKIRVCQHNVISVFLFSSGMLENESAQFWIFCGFPLSLFWTMAPPLYCHPCSPRGAVAGSWCICMVRVCVCVCVYNCFLWSRSGGTALTPEEAFLVCTSLSNTPAFHQEHLWWSEGLNLNNVNQQELRRLTQILSTENLCDFFFLSETVVKLQWSH